MPALPRPRHVARRTALMVGAALTLALAACDPGGSTELQLGAPLAAKGGGGGGNTPAPTPVPPAPPLTGVWTGENRWGPSIEDARHWELTLTQSGTAFSGRLVTETRSSTGATFEGEGNITVNGTLAGTSVTFTMRPKRGGSASTFIGTLSADGRTMRGVNWVPTVPATILGDTITLAKISSSVK